MKKGIHPTYYPDAQVICACGNTWTTGSTKKVIRTEVCSKCHPFFTGQQARIIDIEGQVDRFYKKLQARQEFLDQKKTRDTERVSPQRPVAELNLGTRPTDALIKAGLTTIGLVME
ncbi:50S ribosomal protein L31, partial [bacterium]|nr:50S ribosomal protein L31 [bacterium]